MDDDTANGKEARGAAQSSIDKDNYDLVVVGAGAGGLAAASAAAAEGRRVLLLEHTDRIGGTTAISGGMIWVPANHKMLECGIEDSEADVWRYLEQTVPASANDPRMKTFVRYGDTAIRYLEARTSLRLRPVCRYPDYYPDLAGATPGGRVLEPVPFDGRALGRDFKLMRDPLPEFLLFGGMMISREDIPKLRRVGRSLSSSWYVLKLLLRYAVQRLRAHRGTSLVLGSALVARMLKSARDLGVEIQLGARVDRLLTDRGDVVGLRARINGRERDIYARSGVVLATGGISHDLSLRADYVPADATHRSATVDAHADRGGVRLAQEVGAALSKRSSGVDDALGFWVPVSSWQRPDGSPALFPHVVTDRAKPGLIAINRAGRRFVNEAVSYHEFGRAQFKHAAEAIPAWLVCDRRFLWKYGLGRVHPFSLSVAKEVSSGYLKRAATLEALADQVGVPRAEFVATVSRFNAGASAGQDPEFGRGSNIYQCHLGDGDHRPNPCVAPIEHAPYFAVAVFPSDLGMSAGLLTDKHARVLHGNRTPIKGLYACGNDMHSVMNGAYPGPGITLGPALVFGVIAARHAIGNPLERDEPATALSSRLA